MSRVERTENRDERRGSESSRHADRARTKPTADPNPGHTPTKAEGDLDDIEQALEKREE